MHPRTTGACTGNLNIALKVLRHRKHMHQRHLWAAKLLRKRPDLNRNGREAKLKRHRLIDGEGRLILPPGGLQNMADYHFVLVRGGAWKAGDALW